LSNIDDSVERLAQHDIDCDIADVDQQLNEPELLDLIGDYDGILAGDDELTRRVIESAPRLKIISKWGIGTDSIDHRAASEHGVTVSNTPGAFAEEVADVVICYAVMLTRELHRVDRAVRSGEWSCPRGVSLAGETFGIIGVGNIGAAVARRAKTMGMDVLGNDINPLPEDLRRETGIKAVEKDELLQESMVVSLNTALTDETRHLIGSRELESLGPNGYLINTARGGLVEEKALIEAVDRGDLAGAALEVFEDEPLSTDNPLTNMESVILGSHNAQNTEQAVKRVNRRAVENLIDGLVSNEP
jgi:D-3-phosphoglycerate dehydrogenase